MMKLVCLVTIVAALLVLQPWTVLLVALWLYWRATRAEKAKRAAEQRALEIAFERAAAAEPTMADARAERFRLIAGGKQ